MSIMMYQKILHYPAKYAFTLIELLAVVIIVSILVALAVPQHFRSREQSMDKQAKIALQMIRAAERIYWMENGSYFPGSGSTETNVGAINGNLSLDFLFDGNWTLSITSSGGGFTANATRAAGWGYPRLWTISATMTNATCVPLSVAGCP